MAGEKEKDGVSLQNGTKSCIMHFGDVRETLYLMTEVRLEKFMSCRKRWVNLQGEQAAICQRPYKTFSDETASKILEKNKLDSLQWRYHKTCYKRLCDEEKIWRAEAKVARNPAVLKEPEVQEAAAEKRKSVRLTTNRRRSKKVTKQPRTARKVHHLL